MTRHRVRSYGAYDGTAGIYPNLVSRDGLIGRSSIWDEVERIKRDQPLTVSHLHTEGGILNFKIKFTTGSIKEATNFPIGYFATPRSITRVADPDQPSNAYLGTLLIARTNPSRPVVDLPVSIAELRELPDLVRSAGTNLIKKAASGNLKWEFGVKPLISDIKGLLEFQKRFDNRRKLFEKLREKPICRKVKLYESVVADSSFTGTVTTNSSPTTIQCSHRRVRKSTDRKVWGYVYWYPDPTFKKEVWSNDDLARAARRAVLGLTIDFKTAWELIPWSWLVDWYSNVGDWLLANRSLIPVRYRTPRLCYHYISSETFAMSNNNWLGPLGGLTTSVMTEKFRTPTSASLPSAYIPMLTARQIGILGSLAVLRGR